MLINKNYTKLISATIITRIGDSIDTIAFSWLVFTMTGSRALMGGIFIMSVLPNLIILPFAGVIADLFNKKHLVILSDISRGVFVLGLAVLYFTDFLQVWYLFAFVFVNNVFESVASPSRTGLIQAILKSDEYTKGNSYISSGSSFGSLVGLGIAGIIIGIVGIEGAIMIDAITFFVSALLIRLMNIKYIKQKKEKQSIGLYFKMIKEGFLYLKGRRLLVSLLFLSAIISFMYVPFNVLQPVYVDTVMKLGVEGLTYLGVAFSAGMIVGGIVIGKISDKMRSITAIGLGFLMMGIMYTGLGAVDYFEFAFTLNIIIIFLLTFTFAFFIPVIHAPVYGTIMKRIPVDLIGRMMSVFSIFGLIAMPLGGLVVTLIDDSLSVVDLYIIMGILIIAIALLYWIQNRNKEF
jgi:DHA3 family macrolide efflux protein-like MFS transporter